MKIQIIVLLTSLLLSNAFISHSSQEPPELKAATELSESVVRLFKEEKFDEVLALAKRALEIRGKTVAAHGLSCLAYESQNPEIFKDLAEIQKQFAPAVPPPKPEDIINGKAVVLTKPRYPAEARDMRLSGTVVVLVDVDERGKVSSAKDMCQGLPYLSEAAVEAALKSRFSPTKLSGQPVKFKGVIKYNFVNMGTIFR